MVRIDESHHLYWCGVCICFAGSTFCDGGTSLSQFWGLLHSAGPHHWSGGQGWFHLTTGCPSFCGRGLLMCVWFLSDMFSAIGGYFQCEPAAWRLGLSHVVQSFDSWAEGEPTLTYDDDILLKRWKVFIFEKKKLPPDHVPPSSFPELGLLWKPASGQLEPALRGPQLAVLHFCWSRPEQGAAHHAGRKASRSVDPWAQFDFGISEKWWKKPVWGSIRLWSLTKSWELRPYRGCQSFCQDFWLELTSCFDWIPGYSRWCYSLYLTAGQHASCSDYQVSWSKFSKVRSESHNHIKDSG